MWLTPRLQVVLVILLSFGGKVHTWCCLGRSLQGQHRLLLHFSCGAGWQRLDEERSTSTFCMEWECWGGGRGLNLLLWKGRKEKRRHLLPWEGKKMGDRACAVFFRVSRGGGIQVEDAPSLTLPVWLPRFGHHGLSARGERKRTTLLW